jgi:hypothetical protein
MGTLWGCGSCKQRVGKAGTDEVGCWGQVESAVGILSQLFLFIVASLAASPSFYSLRLERDFLPLFH